MVWHMWMTKQEIECHFLQQALSLNILGFSFFDVYHPNHTYAYQKISFWLHLKGSCRSWCKYTQNWSWTCQLRNGQRLRVSRFLKQLVQLIWIEVTGQTKGGQQLQDKGFPAKVTFYLRWVILPSLEVHFLIVLFEDQN